MGRTTVVIDVEINGIIELELLKAAKTERDALHYIEYQKN